MRSVGLYFFYALIILSLQATPLTAAQENPSQQCEIDISFTPPSEVSRNVESPATPSPVPEETASPSQPKSSVNELNLTLPDPPDTSNNEGVATYKTCINNNGETDALVELRISKLEPREGKIEGYSISGYGSASYDETLQSWTKENITVESGETVGLLVRIEFGKTGEYRIHWSVSAAGSNESIGTDTDISVPSVGNETPTDTSTEKGAEIPEVPLSRVLQIAGIVASIFSLLITFAFYYSDKPYDWKHFPATVYYLIKDEKYDHENNPLTFGIIWEKLKSRVMEKLKHGVTGRSED